jgi:poly(A) polymerase
MARQLAQRPSLAGADWLADRQLQRLLAALTAEGGEARIAGGAVRNGLLGEPVNDIDIATTELPTRVEELARRAGLEVHPTGLDHGTVTVVAKDAGRVRAFEVTTLRIDVETYGRHAQVAFTDDWSADARRRDFTINAMYCDASGTVFDPVGGYVDLVKRRVRFVGEPEARIAEDFLRILRFFRFHARYGRGARTARGLRLAWLCRRGWSGCPRSAFARRC